MYDFYQVISCESRTEIKIKGSRFIGESKIVSSIDEAQQSLLIIKKREYSASHHCYAYCFGIPLVTDHKYSDDGEPSGTAGKPIYDVILGSDMTNLLIVVTRYFGGTKLGTGGLVRAYSQAAKEVLKQSKIKTEYVTEQYDIITSFKSYDSLLLLLREFDVKILDSEFSEKVSLSVAVRLSVVDQLTKEFIELTSGQGRFEKKN